MKTTVTIEFNGEDASKVSHLTHGVDLTILLRDALGEFVAARQRAVDYVAKRYADQTQAFRDRKVREVQKRMALAETLKRGDVTIEVEP